MARRTRRLGCAAVLSLLVLVTSCGGRATDGSPAATGPSTPMVLTADGRAEVSCGGSVGWPPSVMASGLPGVLSRRTVTDAFSELLADSKYRSELSGSFLQKGPTRTPWRVLAVDADTYTLGLGRWTEQGPGGAAEVFTMQGHPGSWRWTGGGTCHLAPLLTPGLGWVRLGAPRGGLDRHSTSPVVEVTEQSCSSGRDPRPFLRSPVVEQTPTSVTVYWTVSRPTGNSTCVGARPREVRLPLSDPLGTRTLWDGSTFPPTRVASPR